MRHENTITTFVGDGNAVKYISTRGRAPALGFEDVLLTGLARDGGLYVPEIWPRFTAAELESFKALSYPELAARMMAPFVADLLSQDDLQALVNDAYATFDADDVLPLKQLGDNDYLLELFHGPTLAFKDVALQVLGRLFDHALAKRGERITIVGATSGDTGSAAIEACRDRASLDIFMLHPKGRVSDVQRRQMTTVHSANVHNVAIDGTFDDCQDLVKAMFNDQAFRDKFNLSAVNSINWARVMAQIVYYFWAALKLGAPDKPVAFSVPTGNFGNVFAGYAAQKMGLPISQLVVGSNRNDILARFFESGAMEMAGVVPTVSPSMDIQVSSNFERLLFDLMDRDGAACGATMTEFRASGRFDVTKEQLSKARGLFDGARYDDAETQATIKQVYDECGELLDPHTAIAVAAGRDRRRGAETPMIALATAHPAKFPAAVEGASGVKPALPGRLSDLFDRPESYEPLANDLQTVESYVEETLQGRNAA